MISRPGSTTSMPWNWVKIGWKKKPQSSRLCLKISTRKLFFNVWRISWKPKKQFCPRPHCWFSKRRADLRGKGEAEMMFHQRHFSHKHSKCPENVNCVIWYCLKRKNWLSTLRAIMEMSSKKKNEERLTRSTVENQYQRRRSSLQGGDIHPS